MNLPKATLRNLCHTCKYKNVMCVECILTAGRRRGDDGGDDQHQQEEMLMMSPPRHYLSSSSCVIGHDVQRKEESFPDFVHGKIDDESSKQQKKLVDSILSFFFGGVTPPTLFSHHHAAVLVIICILWSLFSMTPAFYSYSYPTFDTASDGNIDTSINDFVQYDTTTEQQQKQVEKGELNFLAWVAMVYTAVLLMVAVEGIWVDQFRRGTGYKNNNTAVSIKIHHDTLIKVIGWAFAGGSIMFMVWGVQFVVLD